MASVLRARFINCAIGQNWSPLSFHPLDCLFQQYPWLYILDCKSCPHFIWKECHRIKWIGPLLSPTDSKRYFPFLRLSLQTCEIRGLSWIRRPRPALTFYDQWLLHFKIEHRRNIDQIPWITRLFFCLFVGRRKGMWSHCRFLNRSYAALERILQPEFTPHCGWSMAHFRAFKGCNLVYSEGTGKKEYIWLQSLMLKTFKVATEKLR